MTNSTARETSSVATRHDGRGGPAAEPPGSLVNPFDVQKVRKDFPILSTKVNGRPLVYLDNGATTQKPNAVIDRISRYYREENANIHRGVYHLSQVATEAYEDARRKVARFVNAPDEREVIFTRGTTEAINLVAASYARLALKPGDEILVSSLEHHSNIVPWQIAAEATGTVVRVIPINDDGDLLLDEYAKLLSARTKIVAVNHVSNALGTINEVRTICNLAHKVGAKVLVDGAQWVAHFPTDVRELGCDFYAFSGHKLFGPTGIGVLWGRRELLEAMPPYMGGGDMIESVTFEKTTFAQLPNKFEAGTPDIAGAVGLGAAIDYVTGVGFEVFHDHEQRLLNYATEHLKKIPGLRVIGTAKKKAGVISFVLEDPPLSALDAGTRLDREGVAVRTGHHCCQPLMARFNVPATIRASFAFYNTAEDVDALVAALKKIRSEAGAKPSVIAAPQRGAGAGATREPAIQFPEASAPSPTAAADELADVFEMLDDRDGRNEYVLDLGAKLPQSFESLKGLGMPRIPGCMSEVYLIGRKDPGSADLLQFAADANAEIVRGLIAILQKLFSGQRAADVLAFDVEGFFRRIGLDQFISAQRRNGLAGMVRRIKSLAAEVAGGGKNGNE
jgi:cysteine desulfurase/selenocysteine lyase